MKQEENRSQELERILAREISYIEGEIPKEDFQREDICPFLENYLFFKDEMGNIGIFIDGGKEFLHRKVLFYSDAKIRFAEKITALVHADYHEKVRWANQVKKSDWYLIRVGEISLNE